MIRSLATWDEMRAVFAEAFPVVKRPNNQPEKKGDDPQYCLDVGCRDFTVEDANDVVVKFSDTPSYDDLAEAIKRIERPARIRLVIHPSGDGIAHKGRRRTTLIRLKPYVWFCENLDDKEEMMRNITKGMPPELVHLLYPVCATTARDLSKQYGFKLEKVT